MIWKTISCQLFTREFIVSINRPSSGMDVDCPPKGLEGIHCFQVQDYIQEAVDHGDEPKYGTLPTWRSLCSNDRTGNHTHAIPKVMPGTREGVTLPLDSKERHLDSVVWNASEFAVVPPGSRIEPRCDAGIITSTEGENQ